MGHTRLGRLPRQGFWRQVRDLFDSEPDDVPGMVAAILDASSGRLDEAGRDRSVGYAFYILVRLARASERGFEQQVERLGLMADVNGPLVTFLGDIGDHVREVGMGNVASGHFRDMAGLALRRSLIESVGNQGPGLFGTSVDQLREGFRQVAGAERFGRVTRQFFGDFLARTLHAAVDRELSFHVGRDGSFGDVSESREFSQSVDQYARESAAIVQRYASDWYAKHRWHSKAEITERDAANFVKGALKKLRVDLGAARATA